MNRFRISRSLVGAACGLMLLSSAQNWIGQVEAAEPFTSVEHGFVITFPIPPTAVESERQTASGLTRMVRYRAKHDSFRTSLTVVTFSRASFTDEEMALALNLSRDRQVRGLNGELVSEQNISIDGHPGKELMIAVGPPGKPRTYRYRVRTYYVNHRQYVMSVIGSEKLVLSPKSDDFFNSFTLIMPDDGALK